MARAKAEALFGTGLSQFLSFRGLGDGSALITPRLTEGELAAKVRALEENDVRVRSLVRVLEE